jgi:hypothetical protein
LKLSSEQKEKLRKKGSIEQEIVDVEKEIESLESQEPPPIPSNLLDIDMDLVNSTPNPVVETIKSNDNCGDAESKSPKVEEPKKEQSKIKEQSVAVPLKNEVKVQGKIESKAAEEEFVVVSSTKKNRKR